MKHTLSTVALACGALLWLMLGFVGRSDAAPPLTPSPLPGLALTSYDANIGEPLTVDNLTVFPIYAVPNPEFADAVSLEHALERGEAKVREVGEGDLDAATVGALVIDNLGNAPLIVLAGTVVKGGKQDRQIAQDFVVAGKQTAEVDAFCVEHGRWQQQREGKNTGGNFSASGMLAPRKVRTAAQHDGDQGKVWEEVAETNKVASKSAGSGTLMATLDDDDVKEKRRALSAATEKALRAAPAPDKVLGVAYAIDGKVRGARWFASRQLYEQHRSKLLETAALEAMLTPMKGKATPLTAKKVRDFVDGAGKSAVSATKKRDNAVNTNVYKKGSKSGASEARVVKKKKNKRGEIEETMSAPVTVDIAELD